MRLLKKILFSIFVISMLYGGLASADDSALNEIETLKKKHANNPDEAVYVSAIAKKYKDVGMFAESIQWFEKSLSINAEDIESLFQLGILSSWIGKYDQSINYLNRCLSFAPTHDDAKLALARVYSWQGERKKALHLAKEVIDHNNDYLDAYALYAKILVWEKDYITAKEIYEKLLVKTPDFLEANLGLMDIDAINKKYTLAIDRGVKLLEKLPDNINLHRALGKIYSWRGDYSSAYKHLNKALKIDPDDKQTKEILIRVYRWAGDYKKGISLQKKILEKKPYSVQAHMEIAHLYELSKDEKQAIKWYEKALEIDKDNTEVQARLGLLYSRNSRINDSINALKKRIQIYSNDVASLITLGRVYSWSQKIEESIALYEKALALDDKNQEAYMGLGRAYYYDGRWDKAQKQFEKVLALNPFNKEAKEALSNIKLLRKPHFTTQLDLYHSRNYKESIDSYDERVSNVTVSQVVDLASSPDFSVGLQYRNINEKEDGLGGSKNYRFKGQEYSLRIKKIFLKHFTVLGKVISGSYENDNKEDVLYKMIEDKKLISGFGILKYTYEKWKVMLIYSKEPIYPIIQGDVFKVGHFMDVGASLGYSLFNNLEIFGFYYDRKYYDGRKRYERQLEFRYDVPFYEKIEVVYRYTDITSPSERIHHGGVLFRDQFYDLNYYLEYGFEDNSYTKAKTQKVNLFAYYKLKNSWSLNADITYTKEAKGDRDETTQIKIYVVYNF